MSLQSRLTDLVAAIGADIKDLRSKSSLLQAAQVDSWHTVGAAGEPAFGVKWQAFAGYPPQFKKMPDGTVRIRGMVAPTAGGGGAFTTVFNLPAGYRPSADILRTSLASNTAAEILIDIRVGTNGDVQFGVASSSYHALDLSFATDQAAVQPVVQSVVPQESWHNVGGVGEPAFQNGWVNSDVNRPAQFRKTPDGKVRLRGIIKTGAIGTVAFTLPVGYRPPGDLGLPVDSNGAFGAVAVGSNGAVTVQVGSSAWVDLGSMEFATDQFTFPASIPTITQDGWHVVGAAGEPAFQNGFSNTGTRPLKFRKDPAGRVIVEGDIGSGAGVANDELLVFTLPVGYRPAEKVYQLELISGAAAGGYIVVNTDGTFLAHRGAVGNGMFITAEFWIPQTSFPGSVTTVTQEGWHTVGAAGEPGFQNGWVAAGGVTPAFRKDPAGNVSLRGQLNGGAAGSVAFTLPAGYRPLVTRYMPLLQDGATAGAFIKIDTDGTVAVTKTGTNSVYLDQVFDIGQNTFPAGKSIIPVVTALPPGPTDGDEVYFQTTAMALDGVMWRFRYRGKNPDGSNNTNTFKWEAVGEQQPLRVEGIGGRDYGTMEQVASLNFAAMATPGPTITAPLAGDYDVSGSAQAWQAASGGLAGILLWIPGYGNVPWNNADAAFYTNTEFQTSGKLNAQRLITLAANGTVELRYATSSVGSPVKFNNRNLYVKPIRVG